MNSESFEQHLKQLRPTNCNDRTADTFYQSGWNACEKSARVQSKGQGGLRRSMPTFATGLACGLMLSVATVLWSSTSEDTNRTTVVDLPETTSADNAMTEHAIAEHVETKTNSEQQQVASLETSGPFWKIEDLFRASPVSVEKPSPLSLAARNGWYAQIQTVHHSNSTSETVANIRPEPLTLSPLNQQLLNDLML